MNVNIPDANSSPGLSPSRRKGKKLTTKSPTILKSYMRQKSMTFQYTKVWRRMMLKLKIYFVFKKARDTVILNYDPKYRKLVKILNNTYRSSENIKVHRDNSNNPQFVIDYIKTMQFFATFIRNLDDLDDGALYDVTTKRLIMNKLCKRLKYEYLVAGNYVFKEGDPSNDKYYVIIRGKVSVIVKKDRNVFQTLAVSNAEKDHQETLKYRNARTKTNVLLPSMILSTNERGSLLSPTGGHLVHHNTNPGPNMCPTTFHTEPPQNNLVSENGANQASRVPRKSNIFNFNNNGDLVPKISEKKPQPQIEVPNKIVHQGIENVLSAVFQEGVKIKELTDGEGFGEKALESKAGIRTASMLADTNCEFIVISKDDYLNIIKKYDRSRQAKLQFMKDYIPFLGKINSPEILEDIFFLIKEQDYNRDSYVVQEGQKGDRIFFVLSGYIVLEKTYEISPPYDPDHPVVVKKTIATIGPGSAAGEECTLDEGVYKYAIKAASRLVTLYSLDKKSILYRIPIESYPLIMENFQSKEKFHKENEKRAYQEAREQILGQKKDPITDRNTLLKLVVPASKPKVIKQFKKSFTKPSFVPTLNITEQNVTNIPSPRSPKDLTIDKTERNDLSKTIQAAETQEKMRYKMAPFTRANFASSLAPKLRKTHTVLEELQFKAAQHGVEPIRKDGVQFPTWDLKDVKRAHTKVESELPLKHDVIRDVRTLAEELKSERFDFGNTFTSRYNYKRKEMRTQRSEFNLLKVPEKSASRSNRALKKLYTFVNNATSRTLDTQDSLRREASPLSLLPDLSNSKFFSDKFDLSKELEDRRFITPKVLKPTLFASPSTVQMTTMDDPELDEVSKGTIYLPQSVKDQLKGSFKSLMKSESGVSLRSKKRILDSLNPEKQKAKMRTYLSTMRIPDESLELEDKKNTTTSGVSGIRMKKLR